MNQADQKKLRQELELERARLTRRNALKRVSELEDEDGPGFQMSFTDLMSLLLVFFVLFFSVTHAPGQEEKNTAGPALEAGYQVSKAIIPTHDNAQVEESKEGLFRRLISAAPAWAEGMVNNEEQVRQKAMDKLSQSLVLGDRAELPRGRLNLDPDKDLLLNHLNGRQEGWGSGGPKLLIAKEGGRRNPEPDQAKDPRQKELVAEMEDLKKAMPEMAVSLQVRDRSVILTLGERVTFEEGRAEIKPRFEKMLGRLAQKLATGRPLTRIRIKGHTDSKPIHNQVFPSNWELSSARAARVARLLINKGLEPGLFETIGYGEFKPLTGNDNEKARAMNRRVEIELVTG